MPTVPMIGRPYGGRLSPAQVLERAGVNSSSPDRLAATLPFGPGDATVGLENELQTVVAGGREAVDLPRVIQESNYFQNICKRHGRGEMPRKALSGLEGWLSDNPSGIWENSWVRLPLDLLSPLARSVLDHDLLADKKNPEAGQRSDAGRFRCRLENREALRAPVSYLLKLALVDAVGEGREAPEPARRAGLKLAEHYLNDNTSPETYSFYVSPLTPGEGMGRQAAKETALRFLLTQLAVLYANRRLGLLQTGQRVAVYNAPHPPTRQKDLNECITDSFYRELFMSPCLSGWDKGQEKHRYMHLCHQVLSRAQLNALSRLREAGIITSNLVVLPNTSNISLANNGTHVSLGSHRLTGLAREDGDGLGGAREKYLGDLAIKYVEHFLPLFVGTYSAAPYRLGFGDFHPERALSFLPLELDYTHLRMIWRRWRKKARIKARGLGIRLTPFGPELLDGALARVLGLKGDFLPDFRLVDYLAALMSTDQSPALDGSVGNLDRLKADLFDLGVFDPRMAVYLLYRQREAAVAGYSGFEGRHYSLFESLSGDLAHAVDLQALVTALAYRQIAAGRLDHPDVPDDPEVESERRQIFFGAAIGIPTFYVRLNTGNRVLKSILEETRRTRPSRRYPGYLRVYNQEYKRALLRVLRRKAAGLIEALGLGPAMEDLERRLESPDRHSALGKLTRGILGEMGLNHPLEAEASSFNRAAEGYYRDRLRLRHLAEGVEFLEEDLAQAGSRGQGWDAEGLSAVQECLGGSGALEFLRGAKARLLAETLDGDSLTRLIHLLILDIEANRKRAGGAIRPREARETMDAKDTPPIHRAAER